ncbi:HTH-type transcriptional regulator DegA [Eubacterium plexicaudatum ASF492]|uniref:HTH lacI-type domain-containing protein n=1 Tax=Eubacterium plexicaudatum ASF492 TaxID=1235802 RepID=N2A479_9FIRM|nr:HTH-type transcriptional regulator DegA [Eubacterium plexicaudatum ASF492]
MNIADIAKLAGVSSAAVSRYFNNGHISNEKKEAIRKVVEETGYRPSVQAQTLRTKKTKMIGVIVPKVASSSIGKIVEGILSVLNESEYQTLLAVTQNDPKKESEYLNAFNNKQVDGVILSATVFTAEHKRILKNMLVPVVIVGQHLTGYHCVFHDDYHAAYDLTKLLLQKGRKHLGYIGAMQQDKAVGAERYRGFCDAVRDMGYADLAQNAVTAEFSISSGYEKTKELLDRCGNLDGLVCATDTMAAGAMQYLMEQGIEVPDQIVVAGQGDSDMARVTAPPLITVHYSYERCGEIAVEMLLELLEKGEAAIKEVKLGYYIVAS